MPRCLDLSSRFSSSSVNFSILKVLQLDNNSLRELNVTSLNQFVSLKNLSIRGNDLTEIRDFSYIRNLVYMDLSENELEE